MPESPPPAIRKVVDLLFRDLSNWPMTTQRSVISPKAGLTLIGHWWKAISMLPKVMNELN